MKTFKKGIALVLSFVMLLNGALILKTDVSHAALAEYTDIQIGEIVKKTMNVSDPEFVYYRFKTDDKDAFYSVSVNCHNTHFGYVADGYVSLLPDIGANIIAHSSISTEENETFNCGKLKKDSYYFLKVKTDEDYATDGWVQFRINQYVDDIGDDYSTCTKIEPNKVYSYKLDNCEDSDCFEFTALETAYTLSVSADTDVRYQVYSDDLLTIPYSSLDSTGTDTIELENLNKNANYWIKFWDGYDNGTFEAKQYSFSLKSKSGTDTEETIKVPDVDKVDVKPAKKKVTLKWKKSKGASGYQIYRSMKKKKGYKCIKKIKKGSTVFFTDKKVKSGKTYFYKIRAYKKSGKKIKYGGWSPVKKVKVK